MMFQPRAIPRIGKIHFPGLFFFHSFLMRNCTQAELKVILGHILLNYEFSYPPGKKRPSNICFNAMTVPDPSAQLVFKRRKTAAML